MSLSVITIGIERTLVNSDSLASSRAREYGSVLKKYTVVVPADKDQVDVREHTVTVIGVSANNRVLLLFRMLRALHQELKKNAYDVLSSQDPFELGLGALLLARKHKVGFEAQEHGDILHGTYWQKESILNQIRARIARFVLPRADSVRVVSARIKRHLQKDLHVEPDRMTEVAIVEPYTYKPDHAIVLKNNPEDFVFLTIGRQVPQKNLPLMIKAFKEIADEYTHARLILTGMGPLHKQLQELVGQLHLTDRVRFDTWTDSVEEYYRQADVYVLSSNYEGWGRVLIEAAFAGLPIVMTRVGCADEVFEHNVDALIVERDNKDALIRAMREMIQDKELRERLRKSAYAKVLTLPHRQEALQKYLASWQRAADSSKSKKQIAKN